VLMPVIASNHRTHRLVSLCAMVFAVGCSGGTFGSTGHDDGGALRGREQSSPDGSPVSSGGSTGVGGSSDRPGGSHGGGAAGARSQTMGDEPDATTGGGPSSGGATGAGGSGEVTAGGTSGRGGTGGVTAAGGTTSTGGTSSSGGTPSTGGTTSTGGSSSAAGGASAGGTTSTGGMTGDAGPHDPQVGDACTGTVNACFGGHALVCGPSGKLILNDICTFGCTPEGSYANVTCRKYVGTGLGTYSNPASGIYPAESFIDWSDPNNHWTMVHTTYSANPCHSLNPSSSGYHLASYDEMLKIRDYNTASSGDPVGNPVDGFSWFETLAQKYSGFYPNGLFVLTGTPGPVFGTYIDLQFPGGMKLDYTPPAAGVVLAQGMFFLCVQ
jgi:hypothetical protein